MKKLLALALILGTGAAQAQQDPATAAQAAADMLEAASVQLAEAESAPDRIAALTATVQAYEDGLIALRDGLRRAAIRQRSIEAELDARREEIGQLMGVLQSISPDMGPVLLLHPSGPTGTARAGMIIADATPALQARVAELTLALEEVQTLSQLQESAAGTLEQGLAGAQNARAALSGSISDRTDLPRRFSEDPVATALLIASTETLAGFASGLSDTIDDVTDLPPPDATERMGTLALPAQGEVVRGYNEADAAGITRPGLILAVRPRALVSAPVAATVRFRGPLLDYGNVIILEPAADILVVIAGLAEVFGEAGQVLPEGAPIGIVGGEAPGVDAILTESRAGMGATRSETLYLEVRDGQSSIDPATWFALE